MNTEAWTEINAALNVEAMPRLKTRAVWLGTETIDAERAALREADRLDALLPMKLSWEAPNRQRVILSRAYDIAEFGPTADGGWGLFSPLANGGNGGAWLFTRATLADAIEAAIQWQRNAGQRAVTVSLPVDLWDYAALGYTPARFANSAAAK